MPLYEFYCPDCNCQQEHLVRGEETPSCESCGGHRLTKLLSVPIAHAAGSSSPRGQGPLGGPCGSSCGCHPH
ncbi:MAG: zinc ribbon domain-containing protein [Pirellulales bacterium]|nr:zinc ribbon domain-containing protein [Pirellulales bacterium]